MIKESFIYSGNVVHKRFKPKEHFFKYKVFSLFIDLSEIKEIEKKISFFSYNKFNLISFFDKDHGDRNGTSLIEWVKNNLKQLVSRILIKSRLNVFNVILYLYAGFVLYVHCANLCYF